MLHDFILHFDAAQIDELWRGQTERLAVGDTTLLHDFLTSLLRLLGENRGTAIAWFQPPAKREVAQRLEELAWQ